MSIVLIIVGVIALAFLAQKVNLMFTTCPNCGKMGKSKYMGRTFLGKGVGFRNSYYDNSDNNTKHYEEKYECQECGHRFSRRTRQK